MQKIKALRTFAAGNTIFYPYAKEPYEVEDEKAELWEKSGHCIIVEDLGPQEPESNAENAKGTNGNEDSKTPQNGQNEAGSIDFEAMEYKELKNAAKEANIKGYNTMKKPALIAALKGE